MPAGGRCRTVDHLEPFSVWISPLNPDALGSNLGMAAAKRRRILTGICLFFAALPHYGCSTPEPQPKSEPPKPAAVKIGHFYASPAVVERGDRALLCYGVEAAAAVRVEPPVEKLSPSPNRCFEAFPAGDTTYTLRAVGAGGDEVTAGAQVRVVPRRPRVQSEQAPAEIIDTFLATSTEIQAGQPVTICYDASAAESLSLDPSPQPATPGKKCVSVRPDRTTTYKLTARAKGRTEVRELTIKVK